MGQWQKRIQYSSSSDSQLLVFVLILPVNVGEGVSSVPGGDPLKSEENSGAMCLILEGGQEEPNSSLCLLSMGDEEGKYLTLER